MKKKLTEDQIHRLLEDAQSIALSSALTKQLVEQFGRDFQGMINGNNKKEEENNG